MFTNIIKIVLFVLFINWTIGMHFSAVKSNDSSQRLTAILIAVLLSILTGIVIVL